MTAPAQQLRSRFPRVRARCLALPPAVPLALYVALLGGCAGQPTRKEAPLPFHVAMIPFAAEPVVWNPLEEGGQKGRFALDLDSAQVSRAVAAQLDRSCFTQATLLALPEGVDPATFDRWPVADRDAYWVHASESAGADLILDCELRYSPLVRSGGNEKFWMNLPLFLLGGPACYFVDDVSYHGDARIRGSFYDLNAIRGERATLEDGRAQLLRVESRFQEATLDFLDRAGGNIGSFAASIVVPAGLLSRESPNAERKLAVEAAADLARGLARAVSDGSRELLVADRLAGFHLDPGYVIELKEGRVHFRGEAILRRGDIERMESFSVRVGSRFACGDFEDGISDPRISTQRARYVRFPFEAELPLDPAADHIAVELVGGGPNPGLRTFTIPLPGRDMGRDRRTETKGEGRSLQGGGALAGRP